MQRYRYEKAIDEMLGEDKTAEGGYYFLVDFNGTLAWHDKGAKVIDENGKPLLGKPIPRMVTRVKKLLDSGMGVRIQCGTVGLGGPNGDKMAAAIKEWCVLHIGRELPVTGSITPKCIGVWNDKARGVVRNTGRFVDE
jgi:hypothetical protein